MSRLFLSTVLVFSVSLQIFAADPKPDAVEKAVAIQQAMSAARSYLTKNMPHEATLVLESVLGNVDNNTAFLSLLRSAYVAELKQLQLDPNADRVRTTQINKMLRLIPAPAEAVVAKEPIPTAKPGVPASAKASDSSPLSEARTLFQQKQFAAAAARFAAAAELKANFQPDELRAWSYCRLWLVAEKVNSPKCEAAAAAVAEKEVHEALRLDPTNAELQKFGQALLSAAKKRQVASASTNGEIPGAIPERTAPASTTANPPPAAANVAEKWESLESASFTVRYFGRRDLAEAVSKAAEEAQERNLRPLVRAIDRSLESQV